LRIDLISRNVQGLNSGVLGTNGNKVHFQPIVANARCIVTRLQRGLQV